MKKRNIFLVGLALLGLSSCNDYLDVDAPSKYTEEFIFSDVQEANILLNGLYRSTTNNNTYGNAYINTFLLNSDVEWATNSNETQSANHDEYKAFDAEADATSLKNTWNQAYSTIESANDFITGAEKSPILADLSTSNSENRAALLQMIGEAKCIRAMNYFDLTILIGDIPFSFTRSYENSSNLVMPIVDRDEIQTKLIQDLVAIAPFMKTSSEMKTVERCTKEFAWALIARMALFRGGYSLRHTDDPKYIGDMKRPTDWQSYYQIAKTYTDSVIMAGTHDLNKDWYRVFLDECNYVPTYDDDPIFEIPFTINVSGNVGYIHGPAYSLTSTVGETWGNSSGSLRLSILHRFTYDPEDARRNAIGYWSYNNGNPNLLNNQTNYCNKWSKLFDSEHRMSVDGTGSTGINFPYMRYADVLLMYAEVMNELAGANGNYQGDAGMTALQALAMVHNRGVKENNNDTSIEGDFLQAAANHNKEQFLNDIAQENAWELTGECARKWDLVRWGMLASKIAEAKAEYAQKCLEWPTTIYFNYTDATKTRIDESSIAWYGLENGKTETDYDNKATGCGFEDEEARDKSNSEYTKNLKTISAGLVGTSIDGTVATPDHGVKNRYILPIYTKTIADSRNALANSYGF